MKRRHRIHILCLAISLAPAGVALAKGALVSGPMLGYQAHREALIWLETKDADLVTLDYWIADKPETARQITRSHPFVTPAAVQPMKFVLPLLEMGQRYEYAFTVDGAKLALPYPLTFTTRSQWKYPKSVPLLFPRPEGAGSRPAGFVFFSPA